MCTNLALLVDFLTSSEDFLDEKPVLKFILCKTFVNENVYVYGTKNCFGVLGIPFRIL